MIEQWSRLQLALTTCFNEDVTFTEGIENPFLKRLMNIITDSSAGQNDIFAGYADALRAAQANGIEEPWLPCPPTITDMPHPLWGLVKSVAGQTLSLSVDMHLDSTKATYQCKTRRNLLQPEMDPALKNLLVDTPHTHYRGFGQQAAIRTLLTSDINSTLVINLPTSCGKSLITQIQAISAPACSLTLVIVPTVALAIEQADLMRDMLRKAEQDHGGSYAWVGGQDQTTRQTLKERLKNGTQRALFCSPEAAKSSLVPVLFELAKNNLIGAVIIDEAHLIDQWGAEFRPDFQLIAPLIRSLKAQPDCRFRTLLLSATWSQNTRDVIVEQFRADDSELIEITANFLRPEPEYFVHTEPNPASHKQRVEQLLMSLPRPLILYCTTQEEAESWYQRLQLQQYHRVGLFHGDTETLARRKLISQWANDQLDIMIATSAFGVGMNKSNVRTIIHAAVPENIDRYYQECGRAGRDGKACQAHLVWHPAQMETAESLSVEKLISVEKGFLRWKAMFEQRQPSDIANYCISLDTKPDHIDYQGDRNQAWNRRTLLLMQRTGLIELVFAAPELPESLREGGEKNDQAIRGWFANYYSQVHIRHCNDSHLSEEYWNNFVEKARREELNKRRAAFTLLREWLKDLEPSLCQVLRKFYIYQNNEPELTCGGCPGCRAQGKASFSPTVGTDVKILQSTPKKKARFVGAEKKVYYSEEMDIRTLLSELRVTLRHLIGSGNYETIRTDKVNFIHLERALDSVSRFWSVQKLAAPTSNGAEIVIVANTATALPTLPASRYERIIIAPQHLADPLHPYRKWWDSAENSLPLDTFIRQSQYVNHQ
ncbi:ATP-dependent DNA helicase RecQ [Salmonella enterica]|nr:ATP-dependent DNA helicase RecQ [Salmonella enterica]EJH7016164.1 ATP-dependent DNA helicase RecQ [Salmonella enterica]EJH7440599.1 ATP-dependent DNA helicase RecQ [Salmonella enterica]EJH7879974.1 ATP-dependent DNA helicase RecQ [Salmonella enterica]EJH7881016.1 ATP-dependent DNA helicase RecQ [Salmonella enterica]